MTLNLYVPTRINQEGDDANFLTAGRAATSRADAVDRLLHLVYVDFDDPALLVEAGAALESGNLFRHEDSFYGIVTSTLEVGA